MILGGSNALAADERASIWIQPVGLVGFGAALLVVPSHGSIYIPLGGTFPLSDAIYFNAEVSFFSRSTCATVHGPCAYGEGLILTAGPMYQLTGGWRHGLFLNPKAILTADFKQGTDFQLGLDVGYQWNWNRFYLALVFGVSAGYGIGIRDSYSSPLLIGNGTLPHENVVVGLNLNMLRVGWSI